MSASDFRVDRTSKTAQHVSYNAPLRSNVPHHPFLTTTVPREFVHRASVAEVMLTGWERLGDSTFVVRAQLPRRHGFFTDIDGCHDPLMIAETIRQAGILLAHAEFWVPLDYQFLMWNLAVNVTPEHLLITTTPATLDIEIACSDIKRRGTDLAGLHLEAVIRRDGYPAGTSSATFTCVSPAVYRRLRASRTVDSVPLALTVPMSPQDVGRISPTDVVLSPTPEPDRWQLRVDTHHPVLFDHSVDHVPGMVLLEAARQAATACLGHPCLPISIAGEFARYVELDAPCLIEACAVPRGTNTGDHVLVTGRQEGHTAFTATLTVVPAGS